MYESFTSVVKLIPKYFVLLYSFYMELFLSFLSDYSLLVYKNTIDFCVVIIHQTFLNLVIIPISFLGFSIYRIMSCANRDSLSFQFVGFFFPPLSLFLA